MNLLLPLLIAAIGPDVPLETRFPGADEVFYCAFDRSWDENYDHWPDNWTRRRGPGFPHYVEVQIAEEPSPDGDRCLRVDLDGGGAVVYSPPIAAGPLFSYVLEGYVKTEGLEHDRAFFSLTMLDKDGRRLETFFSKPVCETKGWRKIRVGPVSPDSDQVHTAIIGLHLEPRSREDLRGAALFDGIWLGQLARLDMQTANPYHFYTDPTKVEIHCQASGFSRPNAQVTFTLEDVLGKELARVERPLAIKSAVGGAGLLETFSDDPVGLIGTAAWNPPIPGPGFYRVRTTLPGAGGLPHRREIDLVVIEPQRAAAGGEFGWTLPDGAGPLPLAQLSQLLSQAGITWLKYPLWFSDEQYGAYVERLMTFTERLGARGIELIGLLNDPPEPLHQRYGSSQRPPVAEIFAAGPEVWYPSLEPVMTRLATRIRWWQLGDDTDDSFVDYPNTAGKIQQIKAQMDRIGQDVNLGLGWNWMVEMPSQQQSAAAWRAVTLSADPPLTARELASYLDASREANVRRWVALQPLSRRQYPVEMRADDLVRRMIAAKLHKADAIFCPDPFDSERGLMNDDGTPGELFLPWRTTALVLGGAEYIGSIQLPSGSPNQIFVRDHDAVMVVWNDIPTEEVLYLGEDVRQVDLWGRSVEPPKKGHRHVIRAESLPTFVTGLSEPVTRWRMEFAFGRDRIPAIFGRPHSNTIRMKNTFHRGAGGEVTLMTPRIWSVRPKKSPFRLAEGEEAQRHFEITFPYEASSGRHKVRADFEIQADQLYRFSVYRHIDVGMGNVFIDIKTRLNEKGELEVFQRLVNESDARVSFRCQLFAPNRRRMKTQVIGLDQAQDVKVYRLPNGRELIGKTLWLRAEELVGPRILNYRFVAEE